MGRYNIVCNRGQDEYSEAGNKQSKILQVIVSRHQCIMKHSTSSREKLNCVTRHSVNMIRLFVCLVFVASVLIPLRSCCIGKLIHLAPLFVYQLLYKKCRKRLCIFFVLIVGEPRRDFG